MFLGIGKAEEVPSPNHNTRWKYNLNSKSANQDAGFSIVKYTGDGSSSSTFGHGLSQTPDLYIHKDINNAGTDSLWGVYHVPLDKKLFLNLTNAGEDATVGGSNGTLGTNKATSTTLGFNAGSSSVNNVNSSGADYLVYCFHSVDGYSKVGSYTGTGATGNTVVTGFEPAWIMIKRTDVAGGGWAIIDNERSTSNPRDEILFAHLSDAEYANNTNKANFLSNGFTLESSGGNTNASGGTYIYLAIAADPDTTTPTVENSFDVVTYTGTGSTLSIDTDFKPDFVWIKDRDVNYQHQLYDTVRGATEKLHINTSAESTDSTGLTAFDDNGFTISTNGGINTNGNDYVAWVWKAGDHDDNLPQINTEGSIDSVVSVNAAAGFSIVKYTGNGTAGATIGHGLSATPEMVIVKNLDITQDWSTYNQYLDASPEDYRLILNGNIAKQSVASWNNTAPNSTTFTVGSGTAVNGNGNEHIAYCFHSVTGYQKVGSYSSTGATGVSNQITTGFRPRFLLIKSNSYPENWYIFDSQRINLSGSNDGLLVPNNSDAEDNGYTRLEFTDTGWYWETAFGGNVSGRDYIYLAIA